MSRSEINTVTCDPFSILAHKRLSRSFGGLVDHNYLAGVFLADTSVERFDAELSVTLFGQITVECFDTLDERDSNS